MAIISTNRGNPEATDIAVEDVLPFIGNAVREDLKGILSKADVELSKLFEDRNVSLMQGGFITFTGTSLLFTENLVLELNSKVSGAAPQVISLGSTTRTLSADGRMVYAVINRTAGTAVITDDATTLPAVTAANQEVFIIAKRRDAGDGTARVYFRDGTAMNRNQSVRLGAASPPPSAEDSINIVGLNQNFQSIFADDTNAENSIGNWLTYNDGAVAQPVDMTGGVVSNLTLTRTTTAGQILNGLGSFLITKSGTISTQGEGCSVIVNVPLAYQATQMFIKIPWKVNSGSLVQGDLKVFVYDITNAAVIVPFNNDVFGTQGVLAASFAMPNNTTQVRLGFHFASTTTSNIILSFDDVFMGNSNGIVGPAVSDWKNNLTFTPTGWGTVSNVNFWYRRVGDSMEVAGNFLAGTVGASVAQLTMPVGYPIDATKKSVQVSVQQVGTWSTALNNGAPIASQNKFNPLFYDGSDSANLYFAASNDGAAKFSKDTTTTITNNNSTVAVNFTVPIQTWSSNVTIGQNSTYQMSGILATGTRVTVTPTLLGQYRSYIHTINTNSGTDSNPAAVPNVADGILLYSVPYNAAGAAGQINRYEIFIGQNKYFQMRWYNAAARAGQVVTDNKAYTTTSQTGTNVEYNATTGVLTVDTYAELPATNTTNNVGYSIPTGGGASSPLTNLYFDITVSENIRLFGLNFNMVPVGASMDFRGLNAPLGYLLEAGQAISRLQYADLFAVIGTTYGVGDGSTTFNIPDSRGRVNVARGTGPGLTNRNLNDTGGEETHQLSVGELAAHGHLHNQPYRVGQLAGGANFNSFVMADNRDQVGTDNFNTAAEGGNVPHENMQPFIVATRIIKY